MRSRPELDLWRLWKLATETVRARIIEEVNASSGLSDADLAVLFRVADGPGGEVRQHDLSVSLRWHRSRLSHQLTRMEKRQLLGRKYSSGGVTVALTALGKQVLETAQPIFVAAIRKHFIDLIPREQEKDFRAALERLVEGKP